MRRVIGAAYNAAEYGAGFDQLSSISFLRFVHGDKRGKCAQVGSANRIAGGDGFHVVDGNDRITTGLAERLPTPVQLGHKPSRGSLRRWASRAASDSNVRRRPRSVIRRRVIRGRRRLGSLARLALAGVFFVFLFLLRDLALPLFE